MGDMAFEVRGHAPSTAPCEIEDAYLQARATRLRGPLSLAANRQDTIQFTDHGCTELRGPSITGLAGQYARVRRGTHKLAHHIDSNASSVRVTRVARTHRNARFQVATDIKQTRLEAGERTSEPSAKLARRDTDIFACYSFT